MDLGEEPREVCVGEVATGGTLVDCWNHDDGTGDAKKNRAEVLVIKLSDVAIDSLVGVWANDEYIPFLADGPQTHTGIQAGGLDIYFRRGAPGQTPPAAIIAKSGGKWDASKVMEGCAHVFVTYRDTKDRTIWPQGRPRFLWVVKGARLYDPRKDSTVAGGSGAHRWGTPATYEFSSNAYLIRYNYALGFWNGAHLMVGRGLSVIQAPPERAIPRANICDETVALKAGGTEKRYPAAGRLKSNDEAVTVEEMLAAAMGGEIVDRDGIVDIDPGVAQAVVWEINDDDLAENETITYIPYLTENQMCNTVVARYIDPASRWEDVSAPMRRDYADVIADGKSYEAPLDLPMVASGTQAQRIAEIRRRQARLPKSFSLPLLARFRGMETGDWVGYRSNRYLGGERLVFKINAVALRADFKVEVALRQTAASCFGWVAANDEITPGALPAANTPLPPAIVVASFACAASTLTTGGGTVPAIQCAWADFEDAAVSGMEFQVRKTGETKITTTSIADVAALSAFITAGVGPQSSFDIRARATTLVPGRTAVWTSWASVTTGGSAFDNAAVPLGTNLVTNSDFAPDEAAWSAGWDGTVALPVARGRNATGKFGIRNVVWVGVTGTPTNGTLVEYHPNVGPAYSAVNFRRFGSKVRAGQRVFFAGLFGFENFRECGPVLTFYDKDGTYITEYGATWTEGGGTLAPGNAADGLNMSRIGGFHTAPANSAFVSIRARFIANGTGVNPVGYFSEPMIAIVAADQTARPPYTPGPSQFGINLANLPPESHIDNGRVIGTDANRVQYSQFETTIGWDAVEAASGTITVDSITPFETSGHKGLRVAYTASGAGIIRYGLVAPCLTRLTGGERIYAGIITAVTGTATAAGAGLRRYNAAGTVLGTTVLSAYAGAFSGQGRGEFLAVEASAVWASVFARIDVTAGSGTFTIYEPMIVGAATDQTTRPQFVPGPNAAAGADITRFSPAGGLMPGASQLQTDGTARKIVWGVEEYWAQDGDVVTFATVYDAPPRMKVLQGGKQVDAALSATQVRDDSAVITTTGAVLSLKLKNAVGAVTTQTQTTFSTISTTRREAHKPTSADAWNGKYKINGLSCAVICAKSYTEGEPTPTNWVYEGEVTVTIYTNDGGGWQARATATFSGYATNALSGAPATKTVNVSRDIEFNAPALGQHGGTEFAMEITGATVAGANQINGVTSVTYGTAGAPTSVSRTTANEKVLVRFERGAEV